MTSLPNDGLNKQMLLSMSRVEQCACLDAAETINVLDGSEYDPYNSNEENCDDVAQAFENMSETEKTEFLERMQNELECDMAEIRASAARSTNCETCVEAYDSQDCRDCFSITNCVNCNNCIGIANGTNLQYVVHGIQLTRDEYFSLPVERYWSGTENCPEFGLYADESNEISESLLNDMREAFTKTNGYTPAEFIVKFHNDEIDHDDTGYHNYGTAASLTFINY